MREWREKFGKGMAKERKSPFALFSSVVRSKVKDPKFGRKEMVKAWRKSDDDVKEK